MLPRVGDASAMQAAKALAAMAPHLFFFPPALNLPYNSRSTKRRQPGILMDVHPVLRQRREGQPRILMFICSPDYCSMTHRDRMSPTRAKAHGTAIQLLHLQPHQGRDAYRQRNFARSRVRA